MDAWCYGSAQQRSRLFITITAPGLAPIVQPWHTHSLRKEDTAARNLGKLPNGERFGAREHYPTPFAHVSAGEVTADLPNIGNSSVQTCVSHPDHRVSAFPVPRERALLQCIPKQPPGSGYREAFKLGLIPPSLQKSGKEDTKAYKRVTEAGLIPTITTGLSPQDSCNGATIHWAQDRPITILDARRAQGYLDNEPIVGSLVQQYKIVGNGVDRKVSFALGLALRQAMQQDSENSASSRLSLGATRSRTSKTPGNASNLYKSTPKPDAIRTPGLDGSSDVSDPRSGGTMATPPTIPEDVPPNVTKTTPPSAAAGLLSRISATVAKGLGGMALLPQAYLLPQTPATMSMQAKRRRDEDMPQNEHTAGMPDVQSGASKRAKADEASTPSAVTNRLSKTTPTTDGNDTTKVERRSIESDVREGPKKRSTRLSGLQVEFTPKQWNRQPEREYVVMH
jgi:DNA (cytosine-5)-methyltransferase 1